MIMAKPREGAVKSLAHDYTIAAIIVLAALWLSFALTETKHWLGVRPVDSSRPLTGASFARFNV